MHLLLNLLGVPCALVIMLAGVRVFQVAEAREMSVRTGLALAAAVSGFWPLGQVMLGRNLTFGHVLLLATVAAFIGHRVWTGRRIDPRRSSDFAELL